jgi:predicted MPP superfamily phosphohydrolase
MRHLILFTILYIVFNTYLIFRIKHWNSVINLNKKAVLTIFITFQLILLSNFLYPILNNYHIEALYLRLTNSIFAHTLYFGFNLFILDIIFMVKKTQIKTNLKKLVLVYLIASSIMTISGLYSANNPVITTYDVNINKNTNLNIIMVADTHFGFRTELRHVQTLVNTINKLKPDIVLFAGDIVNNDTNHMIDTNKVTNILKNIKSTYGSYGILGNHDSVPTSPKNSKTDPSVIDFINDSNIVLLQDESILIDNKFYLIGRRDKRYSGLDNNERETVKNLTSNLNSNLPIILLDHQPSELKDTSKYVDLILSGHTHNGQTFPANLLVPFMYENHYGIKKINNSYSITTSGYGTFGPPIRFLTKSEIVHINLIGN